MSSELPSQPDWNVDTLPARTEPTAGPDASHADAHVPGALESALFGRYRLGRELGRGAMGVVYEAFDPKLDRRVAIKLLLRSESPELLARLNREAQAVAQLNHPNVVRVFDVGLSAGRPYIVMEFIAGTTLSEWLRSRPGWRQVVRAFCAAGEGLSAAHAVGLVHRDFKPANVLRDESGGVRVLDFGLARRHGERSLSTATHETLPVSVATLTQTGVAMGTPYYMPPEQHLGQRLTEAADVFAFGVSLYEGLFGALPFSSRRLPRLLMQKQAGLPERAPSRRVPKSIYAVVRRCVAFDPADRFHSMKEAVAALRQSAPPRRPWLLVAGVGVALVGVVASSSMESPASSVAEVVLPPTRVNEVAEAEALELVAEAVRLRTVELPPDAMGAAYAALYVASWSGSDTAYAAALLELGVTLRDLGYHRAAKPILEDAVEKYVELGDGREAVNASVSLIYALDAGGFDGQGAEVLRRASAMIQRFGLEDDVKTEMRYLVGESVTLRRTDPPAARAARERVLSLHMQHPELQVPARLASVLHGLAVDELVTDPAAALGHFQQAREILTELGEPTNGLHALATDGGIVQAQMMLGNTTECIARARALFERAGPLRPRFQADAAVTLSGCYRRAGQLEQALIWANRGVAVIGLDTLSPRRQMSVLNTQANALMALERFAEAEPIYQRIVVISEADSDASNDSRRLVLVSLGECVRRLGDAPRAEGYYLRALELPNERDKTTTSILRARLGLGMLLVEQGAFGDALEVLALPETEPSDDPTAQTVVAAAKGYRAEALWNLRKPGALDLAREALAELAEIPAAKSQYESLKSWIEETAPLRPPK